MIYKNLQTGAVIVTDHKISGGDWEVHDPETDKKTPTIPELQSLLTELGVEFDPKAKKQELLDLYEANKVD